jgi:diguanylate cyclase (GGDEF)-like protein
MGEAQRAFVREHDALQRKVMLDGITRLWNRAATVAILGRELARAKRGAAGCIAMIDADYFGRPNDARGHRADDAVLAELAARIRRGARDFDVVGHLGGERFAVLLSNCSPEAAKAATERIRSCAAAEPLSASAGTLGVALSIGLAAYNSEHADLDQVMSAADAALCRAQARGRNCIEFSAAASGAQYPRPAANSLGRPAGIAFGPIATQA